MALSSDVLVWVSLAELGLAVVIFTQGGTIDKFLRQHRDELKLRSVQPRGIHAGRSLKTNEGVIVQWR
jgi:hypothetical protein